MEGLSYSSRFILLGLCLCFSPIAHSQDLAELSMRARINLYDEWEFDSVAYYHDLVIGKEFTPAFAYSDHGWYLMLIGRQQESMKMIRKAAEMAPADVQLSTWYAWALLWDSRVADALKWINKAIEMDPGNGETLFVASLIYAEEQSYSQAISYAVKASSSDSAWRAGVPLAFAIAGKKDQALELAMQIETSANANDALFLAEMYTRLNDHDKALEKLELALRLRHPFLPWLELWPGIRPLQNEQRFKQIVLSMNLPD